MLSQKCEFLSAEFGYYCGRENLCIYYYEVLLLYCILFSRDNQARVNHKTPQELWRRDRLSSVLVDKAVDNNVNQEGLNTDPKHSGP